MWIDPIARIAVCIKERIHGAEVNLHDYNRLEVILPRDSTSRYGVECHSHPADPNKRWFESSIYVRHASLTSASLSELGRLASSENSGLRGVSVIPTGDGALLVRTGFFGSHARTRDEEDAIVIDLLSLARYVKLFTDRVTHSSVNGRFSQDMYHSQFVSKSGRRQRSIVPPRSFFSGSNERVFAQVLEILARDHGCQVDLVGPENAQVLLPTGSPMILRISAEAPLLTSFTPLDFLDWAPRKTIDLTNELNLNPQPELSCGHFETGPDGMSLSFSCWKHLTSDLRSTCVEQIMEAVTAAEQLLRSTTAPVLRERDAA